MSATTKKKHVTKEVLEEYALPEGEKQVVKVVASKGNNLHEVVSSTGETFLVSMPNKFRKHVWIKRGDFIMVEPIEEGVRVKAEITHILFKEQIKHIKDKGMWPEAFSDQKVTSETSTVPDDMLPPCDSDNSDEELGDLVKNLNRATVQHKEDTDTATDSDVDTDASLEMEVEMHNKNR